MQILESLKNKKAVFCEKPLASSLADTRALYDLADEMKTPLFCSLNRRFDPSLNQVRNHLQEETFGKPLVVKTTARDYPIPPIEFLRTSGGMVHDCGIHDIDYVCWMLNAYPDEVYCTGFCYDPNIKALGDYDNVTVILKFTKPREIIATLDLSRRGVYGYDQRVEILCENGMLESQHQRSSGLVVTPALTSKNMLPGGTTTSPILTSFPQRYADSYKLAMHSFISSVKSSSAVAICRQSVIFSILVADAADRSLHTGKSVKIDYEKLSIN